MIEIPCAICAKIGNYTVVYPEHFERTSFSPEIFSARRQPDRIHYQMVRCRTCGLLYSNPILEPDKINTLYQQSRFTYHDTVNTLQQTYGRYLKIVANQVHAQDRLLEIGCGSGFFLAEAKRAGFHEVFGVEPSQDAVNQAAPDLRKIITVSPFTTGLFPQNFFDVICFFQVIDHIVDPNLFLKTCVAYLKPGGVVLCICHNISAWTAKVLGERCPMIDIEHIYLFNPKTITQIFQNNNFQVESVFTVANTYPLRYWLTLLSLPGKMKKLLPTALNVFRLMDVPISLRAGNMGIIAKKL